MLNCKKCGAPFEPSPLPNERSQYEMQKWAEQNRICEKCAEVDRPTIISPSINRNWTPGDFNPENCDVGKIGVPPPPTEEEQALIDKQHQELITRHTLRRKPQSQIYYSDDDE